MRKILLTVTAALITSTSTNIVVACQSLNIGDVWVITDGGELFDNAFNQQVLEGSKVFADKFNKNRQQIANISGFSHWKNEQMKINYIISNGNDISTLQNNYNLAAFAGAKVIICSGFHHITSLTPQIQNLYKKYGIRFIMVDAIINNPIDVASITYAAEESSFFAGLAGALWLAANYQSYPDGLKMSTFGAVPADTIVSYMSGFYWGVNYYNRFRLQGNNYDANILTLVNQIRQNSGKAAIDQGTLASDKLKITFDKLANSFSGGFDSATPSIKSLTANIVDKEKNNIILPVAGAQTKDLIGAIQESSINPTAKIIGVDTDQSTLYNTASNLFLTSALKGINPSVDWMLWNAFKLQNDNDHITFNGDTDKYFTKINQPLAGKYVGIADNKPIEPIYTDLVENAKYITSAQLVTSAFEKLKQKVSSESTPDWAAAWANDVQQGSPDFDPFAKN